MADVPVVAAIEVVKLLLSVIREFVKTSNLSEEELQAWDAKIREKYKHIFEKYEKGDEEKE